jgi:membrane-associated protease RseP (regulator of RpoE activity)
LSCLVAALVTVGYLAPSLLLALGAIVGIIMLHEAGHLVVARRAGMKTTEYFLGFGPKIWSFRRGEMEYGIKAIPAGGYVKIVGMTSDEQIDEADEARAYRSQSAPRRVAVGFAGIGAQLVLAVVLAFGAVVSFGFPNSGVVLVNQVASWHGPAVPAALAGLHSGDRILAINGQTVTANSDFSKLLHAPPATSQITIERDGKVLALNITPVPSSTVSNEQLGGSSVSQGSTPHYLIGVSLREGSSHLAVLPALGHSFTLVGQGIWGITDGMGHIVSPAGIAHYANVVTTRSGAEQAAKTGDRPESIVGIVHTTAQAEQSGAIYFVSMIIIIDLAVALLNLLPVLPLDGGHIAIAAYEGVRSRKGKRYKANLKPFLMFSGVVMVFLVLLVVTSVWLDIAYPIVPR